MKVKDEDMLFIPPCCVDKKLPAAVLQVPYRALTFHTHGDVTMEKFYRAVSHLVADKHVMVLTMPTVIEETAYFLAQCFERGWISALVLSSQSDAENVVSRFLSDYADRIIFATDKNVTNAAAHMVLYSDRQALTLAGPMLAWPASAMRLAAYSLQYLSSFTLFSEDSDWGNPIRNILMPDVLRLRKSWMKRIDKVKPKSLRQFLEAEFPPYQE